MRACFLSRILRVVESSLLVLLEGSAGLAMRIGMTNVIRVIEWRLCP